MVSGNPRAAKINWMMRMRHLIEEEDMLIKQFCLVFGASKRNAKEILEIIK